MNFNYLWADNHRKPNLEEVSNMVGMHGSTYNNIGALIYNSFPKHLKFLDTEEKKAAASMHMTQLYRIKIIFHGLSWAFLIFVLALRFGNFFALACSLGILFFPGSHRHAVLWMHSFTVTGLLPAYILGLYPLVQKKCPLWREGAFWVGLAALSSFIFYFTGPVYFFFVPLPLLGVLLGASDLIQGAQAFCQNKKIEWGIISQKIVRYALFGVLLFGSFAAIHLSEWKEAQKILPDKTQRGAEYKEKYPIFLQHTELYFNFYERNESSDNQNLMSVATLRRENTSDNLYDYYVYKNIKSYLKNLYYLVENYLAFPAWGPSYYISTLIGKQASQIFLFSPSQLLFFLAPLNILNIITLVLVAVSILWFKFPQNRQRVLIAAIPLGLYGMWLILMFHTMAYLFGHLEISSNPIMPLYLILLGMLVHYSQMLYNSIRTGGRVQ